MISRSLKNKELVSELKHEKAIKISKKILKIFLIILVSFTLLYLYMRFIGTKFIKTNEIVIKDVIPDSFKGYKILHFTDLLYDDETNLEYLQKEINLINPDIVFFTGNLINKDTIIKENDIKKLNKFFKDIPYKIGKYSILGNLDNNNYNLIMENTDFINLNNELITIYNKENDAINIVGININEKKEIIKNNTYYTITIINNYDYYNAYNIDSNLVFAGNNLGGEIKIFNIPLINNNKYMDSFYKINNSSIYISNGIGSIHKLRFMNHPSINVYRLDK